jgi:RsiW-degrading membrane proteinase PrsW (M82 family)
MNIYVIKQGEQTGPYSKEQILAQIRSCELQITDIGWHDGLEDWRSLGSFIDLSPPPPPPPADANPDSSRRADAGASRSKTDRLNSAPGSSFGMEDGGSLGIAETVGLFRSLDYGFLLPFRKVFSQGLLRKKAVRWVMLFGVTPVVILHATILLDLSGAQAVGLLSSYFCLFWALYFYSLVNPGKEIWKRGVWYAVFTAAVCLPAVTTFSSLPILKQLNEVTSIDNIWPVRLVGLIFGVGVVEETSKALPLLLFGMGKKQISNSREGLFLGFMSGLGFAVTEAIGYVLGASNGNAGDFMFQTVFRFMSGPLFHGAWAGVVGWFIGLSATREKPRWPIIVVGIAFMAVVHGINDFFSDSIYHIPVIVIFILIFMAYLIHGEEEQPQGNKTVAPPITKPEVCQAIAESHK